MGANCVGSRSGFESFLFRWLPGGESGANPCAYPSVGVAGGREHVIHESVDLARVAELGDIDAVVAEPRGVEPVGPLRKSQSPKAMQVGGIPTSESALRGAAKALSSRFWPPV